MHKSMSDFRLPRKYHARRRKRVGQGIYPGIDGLGKERRPEEWIGVMEGRRWKDRIGGERSLY